MTRALVGVAAFVVLGAVAVGATAAARVQTKAQQVTLIGDSVADAIVGTSTAVAEARREVSLNLQVAPCRRIAGDSCPYNGVRPPNVIDLVQSLGPALGPNVVIAVGYNDHEDTFAQDLQSALTALEGAGAKHIFWLTLRAARHPYLTMNAALEAAAASHPDLTRRRLERLFAKSSRLVPERRNPSGRRRGPGDGDAHPQGSPGRRNRGARCSRADVAASRRDARRGRTPHGSSGPPESLRTGGRCSSARPPGCTSRRTGSCAGVHWSRPARTRSTSASRTRPPPPRLDGSRCTSGASTGETGGCCSRLPPSPSSS